MNQHLILLDEKKACSKSVEQKNKWPAPFMLLHAMDKNNLVLTCITREECDFENLGLGGRKRIQVMRRPQSVKTNGASFSYVL